MSCLRPIRGDKKGQFIIIGAIIIAVFMFALTLTISQMNVQRQTFSFEPVDEIVITVSSDFERCLQSAFSKASQGYLQSYLVEEQPEDSGARELLDGEVRRWLNAVSSAYSGYGINVTFTADRESGSCLGLSLEWSEDRGTSYVYTTFGLDVAGYGLEGLALTKSIRVDLNILEAKMSFAGDRGKVTMKFTISEKVNEGRPTKPSIKGISVVAEGGGVDESSIKLDYLGQGVYLVEFETTSLAVREVRLAVTTDKGAVVAAKKGLCVMELKSDDLSTPGEDNEGTFTVNGTTFSPGSAISAFPDQILHVTFSLDGELPCDLSVSGPLDVIEQSGTSATIRVLHRGDGRIAALYGVQTSRCFVNVSSRELNGESFGKGVIVVDGAEYSLSRTENGIVTLEVPPNSTISVSYSPERGYVFRYWEASGGLVFSGPSSQNITVTVVGNGSLIAIYEPSRNSSWQTVYLSPLRPQGQGQGHQHNFTLTLNPEEGEIKPPISYGQPSPCGNSDERTPSDLMLGDVIKISLYARATSKGSGGLDLKVSFGYYDYESTFHLIGSDTKRIEKSSEYREYVFELTVDPSMKVIPKGSKLVLILERADQDPGGGTIQIQCGSNKSRIVLW